VRPIFQAAGDLGFADAGAVQSVYLGCLEWNRRWAARPSAELWWEERGATLRNAQKAGQLNLLHALTDLPAAQSSNRTPATDARS
jgi:hypothetical protein